MRALRSFHGSEAGYRVNGEDKRVVRYHSVWLSYEVSLACMSLVLLETGFNVSYLYGVNSVWLW
jgi:hypothetical protein